MKTKLRTRVLSWVLAFVMVIGMALPVSATESSTSEVDLKFTDAADGDRFDGATWSVQDGVLKAGATWQRAYLNQELDLTKDLTISFDYYIEYGTYSGSLLAFGIMTSSTATSTGLEGSIGWINRSQYGHGDLISWKKDGINGPTSNVNIGDQILYSTDEISGGESAFGVKHNIKMSFEAATNVMTIYYDNQLLGAACTNGTNVHCDLDAGYFSLVATNTGAYIDNLKITAEGVIEDFEQAEGNALFKNMDTKKATLDTLPHSYAMNANGQKRFYVWGDAADWTGAEYLQIKVTNPSATDAAGMKFEFYEKDSAGFGMPWYVASGTEYYLYASDGNGEGIKLKTTELSKTNAGQLSIPAGFTGDVVIPLTSLEQSGWVLPYEQSSTFGKYADLYGKFGEANIPKWDKFNFFDVYFVSENNAATESFTIDNMQIMGSNMPSVTVASPYKKVIQAITDIGTVNAGSKNQILYAKELYENLDSDNRELVENYEELEAAIDAYSALDDCSGYVGAKGKVFTGKEGVEMADILTTSPSTISAWIKVAEDVTDSTHVGTIVGNLERVGGSQYIRDSIRTVSVEVTTDGHPKFTWRKTETDKVTFVVKNVDVRTGEWMNLAFVRDVENAAVHCYVNGLKVATKSVTATDIADIIFTKKPLIIGSDYTNDAAMAPNFTPDFNGSIANVRMYAQALSEEQMKMNVSSQVADAGIMHDINFYESDDTYYDAVDKKELQDAAGWIDNGSSLLAESDYTFAILGDTQMLLSKAKDANGNNIMSSDYDVTSNAFYKNVQWLIDNKEALNLQYAFHVGDLTDNANNSSYATWGVKEYEYGLQWLDALRTNNIPYALARGNHDGHFDEHYTVEQYAQYAAGLQLETSMTNAYYTFEVSGQKYLVVVLDVEPTDAALEWANNIVSTHSEYQTIVMTHAYLSANGQRFQASTLYGSNWGETIWTKFVSKHKNIFMVLSGHDTGTDIVHTTDVGENGNIVHQVMVDESILNYTARDQMGVIALMSFTNGGNTIAFNYYSPSTDRLYRSVNQFTIDLAATTYGQNIVSKADMMATEMPAVQSFAYWNENTGAWGHMRVDSSFDANSGAVCSNQIGLRSTAHGFVFALDVEKDGVFTFNDTAYVKTLNGAWMNLGVYLIDGSTGEHYRAFPKDNSVTGATSAGNEISYVIKGTNTEGYLKNFIPGIQVKQGDKIYLSVRYGGTGYVSISGNIAEANGTITSYDAISLVMNTSGTDSSAAVKGLYESGWNKKDTDGQPINYNGWTAGWFDVASNTYPYTLTVKDIDGSILSQKAASKNIVLHELERTGEQFLGYMIDGKLYPAGATLTLTDNTEITAVFADFHMINGASVRMANPTGLRFSTQTDIAKYLEDNNVSAGFGTLIAMADSLKDDAGIINYQLLTSDYNVTKLNIPCTVKLDAPNGYTQFNAAVVGLSESLHDSDFVGRSYLKITYADGSEKTFYASVNNNARNVKSVAEKALTDISILQTKLYPYEISGGYSPYSAEHQVVLNSFASGSLIVAANDTAFENIIVPYQVSETAYSVHVSPTGKDSNDGATPETAVASLIKAQELVQDFTKNNSGVDCEIVLADGEHFLEEPLALTTKDVAEGGKLYIRAACPRQASITGAKQVESSVIQEIYDAQVGRIWKIPCEKNINQLYVNNTYAVRARYPDAGEELRLLNWDKTLRNILVDSSDISEFQVSDFAGSTIVTNIMWSESFLRISELEKHGSVSYVNLIGADQGVFSRTYPRLMARQSYHFENSKAFLSTAGEWFYDANEKMIYYIPYDAETLAQTTVRIPYTEELIVIEGSADQPVNGIYIEGLNFKYTANGHVDGKVGNQANKDDGTGKRFEGTIHDGRPISAISVSYAEDLYISGNVFANMGGGAIDFLEGVKNSVVERNVFSGIGGSGVLTGAIAYSTDELSTEENTFVKNITVKNNYFNDICWQEYAGAAVVMNYAVDSIITQNTIHNTKYSGISIGWGWKKTELPFLGNNEISNNRISNTLTTLCDGAAIYMVGCQPNTIVKGNYIDYQYNSVYTFPKDQMDGNQVKWATAGIYLDQGVGGTSEADKVQVVDNVIVADRVDDQAYNTHNAKTGYYVITEPEDGERNTIIVNSGVQEDGFTLNPQTPVLYGFHTENSQQVSLYGENLGTSSDNSLILSRADGKYVSLAKSDIVQWTDKIITFRSVNYCSGDVFVLPKKGEGSNKLYMACNVDEDYNMYTRFNENWGGLTGLDELLAVKKTFDTQGYACSSADTNWPASYIGDDDTSKGWSSAYPTDTNPWVSWKLETASTVDGIVIYARAGQDQPECRSNFEIYGTDEKGNEYLLYTAGDQETFEANGNLVVDLSEGDFKDTVFTAFKIARPEGNSTYFFVAEVAVF